MKKAKISLKGELEHSTCSVGKTVPFKDSHGDVVGEAKIGAEEVDVFADVTFYEDPITVGLGGVVISREENIITGFSINEVSINIKGDV